MLIFYNDSGGTEKHLIPLPKNSFPLPISIFKPCASKNFVHKTGLWEGLNKNFNLFILSAVPTYL